MTPLSSLLSALFLGLLDLVVGVDWPNRFLFVALNFLGCPGGIEQPVVILWGIWHG